MIAIAQVIYYPYHGTKTCSRSGCCEPAKITTKTLGERLLICPDCWEILRGLDANFPTIKDIQTNGSGVRAQRSSNV